MLEALKERVNQDTGLVRRGRYLTTSFLLQSGDIEPARKQLGIMDEDLIRCR